MDRRTVERGAKWLYVGQVADPYIQVILRYDTADPYAVTMALRDEVTDTWADWTFARDLFADGLHAPAGMGDVQVWPYGPGRVGVALHSSEGDAFLIAPRRHVEWLVGVSFRLVPRGREVHHLKLGDLDADLATLVEEE